MSIFPVTPIHDGHYDEDGSWQRDKLCFAYCGKERCTCYPPNDVWQLPVEENDDDTKLS